MTTVKARWKAYFALFFGIVCISWSPIWVKLANVPGTTAAFYRMAGGVTVMLPVWLLTRGRRGAWPDQRTLLYIAIGGICFALDLSLWHFAILSTTAATATLLANNTPIWVGLGMLFIFHKPLGAVFWMGLLICIAGVVMVIGHDVAVHPGFEWGNIAAIVASMFYAGYLLSTERIRVRVDTFTLMTFSMLASMLVLYLLCRLQGTPLRGFSAGSWWALLGLAMISQLLGWLTLNYALGYINAAYVALSMLIQPILATVFAIWLLGERLQLIQLMGGGIVLAGVFWVNYKGQK